MWDFLQCEVCVYLSTQVVAVQHNKGSQPNTRNTFQIPAKDLLKMILFLDTELAGRQRKRRAECSQPAGACDTRGRHWRGSLPSWEQSHCSTTDVSSIAGSSVSDSSEQNDFISLANSARAAESWRSFPRDATTAGWRWGHVRIKKDKCNQGRSEGSSSQVV